MIMALTNKQQAFINAYLECWNASEAARRAGYSVKTAGAIGAENLTKPEISEEIQRRIQENTMQANEVLIRLTKEARLDIEDYYDFPGSLPMFNPEKARERGVLYLVKGFSITDKELKINLPDAHAALDKLARIHGLYNDKTETEHKGEVKIVVEYIGGNPKTS